MIKDKEYKELDQAFIQYLDTYFIDRNLAETIKMFNPCITGFGTGVDEKLFDFDGLKTLYSRDILQAPNPIHYTILKSDLKLPVAGTGIVTCELNIHTHILQQEIKINNLRLSLVFIKTEQEWGIAHMHISLPTSAHDQDEAYPIKELEERNVLLQRLVTEKTKSLDEANQELVKRLGEIKTLSGLLPICASCKKIRDDKGYWKQIELYIKDHSDAEFTHSICPECKKKLYPEL